MNSMTNNVFFNFFELFKYFNLPLFAEHFICDWEKNIFLFLNMILQEVYIVC